MNNAEVVADFRRRYEGTYAWLWMDRTQEETLIHIDRIEDNNDKVATINVTGAKYGQLVLNLGSEEYELRFKYPPVGVFQHGDDAMFFRRRPMRQFRRGICADNSYLGNCTRGFVGNRARFGTPEVQSAFDHKTFGEKEALKMLDGGKHRGVALRNNFAMILTVDENPDHLLFHWDQPVARINTKGKVTRVYEKAYAGLLAEGAYK